MSMPLSQYFLNWCSYWCCAQIFWSVKKCALIKWCVHFKTIPSVFNILSTKRQTIQSNGVKRETKDYFVELRQKTMAYPPVNSSIKEVNEILFL